MASRNSPATPAQEEPPPSVRCGSTQRAWASTPAAIGFDHAGHGTLQFPERDVYALAGFSNKTMGTMSFLGTDKRTLITQIESVELLINAATQIGESHPTEVWETQAGGGAINDFRKA